MRSIYLDAELTKVFDGVAEWMRGQNRLTGPAPDMRKVFVPEDLRKVDASLVKGF